MEKTFYYRYDDGAYSMVTRDPGGEAPHIPGAQEITQAEYEAGVAALEEANGLLLEQQQAEEREQARQDYEALIDTGVPDATARRLSGHPDDDGS